MTWNPDYRESWYDPRMAYLSVVTESKTPGVLLQLNDYVYTGKGLRRVTLFRHWFNAKKHGGMDAAITTAKKLRNKMAPKILGERFLVFGPRPRPEAEGVCDDWENNRYRAYWRAEIIRGQPRLTEFRDFYYGPQSSLTKGAALKAAKRARKNGISESYDDIELVRDFVLSEFSPKKKVDTRYLKRAA